MHIHSTLAQRHISFLYSVIKQNCQYKCEIFSEQNYFLYRAYTINKYSRFTSGKITSMVLNKIVNINVQREIESVFYFLSSNQDDWSRNRNRKGVLES